MYNDIYKSNTGTPHHHLPSSIVEHSAVLWDSARAWQFSSRVRASDVETSLPFCPMY